MSMYVLKTYRSLQFIVLETFQLRELRGWKMEKLTKGQPSRPFLNSQISVL